MRQKKISMSNKMSTKNTWQKHGVCFVLANYFLTWDPSWNVVDISSDTALAKIDFPFTSGYKLQKASWLWVIPSTSKC